MNGVAQQGIQKGIAWNKIIHKRLFVYIKWEKNTTIIDSITKGIALQDGSKMEHDNAEKMSDRIYIELQIALLRMAGAPGEQGFGEWQAVDMYKCTNKLVTVLFITAIDYVCGLPKGSGFTMKPHKYAMKIHTFLCSKTTGKYRSNIRPPNAFLNLFFTLILLWPFGTESRKWAWDTGTTRNLFT